MESYVGVADSPWNSKILIIGLFSKGQVIMRSRNRSKLISSNLDNASESQEILNPVLGQTIAFQLERKGIRKGKRLNTRFVGTVQAWSC